MTATRPHPDVDGTLRAGIEQALGGRALDGTRLKENVHRLRVEVAGTARSVIAKRSDPLVARRNVLVARRWLPAAGLSGVAPPLLAVWAEPDGEATWQVYEDVPGRPLATQPPVDAEIEAAVDALARVHTSFAAHPLLPECRVAGGDRGMHFFSVNVEDAITAVEGVAIDREIRDALLGRLRDLRAQSPARARALAVAGPDTLLHGDLWPSNVVVTGDAGVRLIDWDEAGVGPYGYDLSTLLLRFAPAHRPAILDAYGRAVKRLAGWELPPPRDLRLIFETAAQARLASLLVWSIAAAAGEDWLVVRLASIVEWLDDVTPVIP